VYVGAAQVTLLDREPKALQCALLTAAASGVEINTSPAAFSDSAAEAEQLEQFTARLQMSGAQHNSAVHGQRGTISAALFDWNNEFAGDPYDTVIACDVLYENYAVEPLARLLPTMLAGPVRDGRRILLTDPQDRTPEHRRRFLDLLAQQDPTLVVDFVKTVEVDHATSSGAPVKVCTSRFRAIISDHKSYCILLG
jgi:ETFB lysine methyltransferase